MQTESNDSNEERLNRKYTQAMKTLHRSINNPSKREMTLQHYRPKKRGYARGFGPLPVEDDEPCPPRSDA